MREALLPFRLFLALIFSLALVSPALAEWAEVIRVVDGDTIALTGHHRV